jgi:putative aldouronate transport system substrate-binding protein
MKKRIISMFLALLLLLTMLAGCAQKATETQTPQSETKTEETKKEETKKEETKKEETKKEETKKEETKKEDTPAEDDSYLKPLGELPLVKTTQTLSIGIPQNMSVTSYEDNYLTKYIEEQTGIQLEFVFLPNEDSKGKFSMMVAANETLPDIIMTANNQNFDAAERLSYGQSGTFLDLNDLFAENAYFCKLVPNVTDEDWDYILKKCRAADGGLYGFPGYDSSLSGMGQFDWQVNVKWLEYLSLEMPKTLDEFTEMLIAFRDGDPNQNGLADEIPYYDQGSWNAETWYQLINMFVYYDPYYHVNVTDGKIWVPYTTDEFKQALEYLNMLVEENLLSPLTFTKAEGETTTLTLDKDGTTIIGLMGCYAAWACEDPNAIFDYEYLPLFEGPVGVKYSPNRAAAAGPRGNITKDCKDPVLAIRFLDWLSAQRLYTRYGEKGVNWVLREDDPETFDKLYPYISLTGELNGAEPIYAVIDDPWTNGSEMFNANWGNECCYISDGLWGAGSCSATPNYMSREEYIEAGADPATYFGFLYAVKNPDRIGAIPEEVIYNLNFTLEESEEALEMQTNLETYVKECIASFAMGIMDLDTQWDEYLAALNGMGLEQYLTYAQAAYDRE